MKEKVLKNYYAELDSIAKECAAEGYPSRGENYELRTENLWEDCYAEDYRMACIHDKRVGSRIKSAVIHTM